MSLVLHRQIQGPVTEGELDTWGDNSKYPLMTAVKRLSPVPVKQFYVHHDSPESQSSSEKDAFRVLGVPTE